MGPAYQGGLRPASDDGFVHLGEPLPVCCSTSPSRFPPPPQIRPDHLVTCRSVPSSHTSSSSGARTWSRLGDRPVTRRSRTRTTRSCSSIAKCPIVSSPPPSQSNQSADDLIIFVRVSRVVSLMPRPGRDLRNRLDRRRTHNPHHLGLHRRPPPRNRHRSSLLLPVWGDGHGHLDQLDLQDGLRCGLARSPPREPLLFDVQPW